MLVAFLRFKREKYAELKTDSQNRKHKNSFHFKVAYETMNFALNTNDPLKYNNSKNGTQGKEDNKQLMKGEKNIL